MPRQPPFHVWVDMTGIWSAPAPGVLLAWRHSDRRGWEAWVVRVESYSTGVGAEVLMSQSWVPAALVRPVDRHHRATTSGHRRAHHDADLAE
ncbi:hypothetical protein ACFQW6_04010 [Nocardioides sp. GCM10028917]|uniref:hypothetical protein n=1 Tax=Nocardioides sp. GCM10028917 TaxID=3273408 RepID=UPI0036197DBD